MRSPCQTAASYAVLLSSQSSPQSPSMCRPRHSIRCDIPQALNTPGVVTTLPMLNSGRRIVCWLVITGCFPC
jgi:hypothetical protein